MAVGNALIEMYKEIQEDLKKGGVKEEEEGEKKAAPKITPEMLKKDDTYTGVKAYCPECGEQLVFEGGCNVCKNCGWSKCL